MPSPRANNPRTTTAATPAPSLSDRSLLLKLFFAALAVRWIYALAIYALMGDDGLKGVDSFTYTGVASDFANALRAGSLHGPQWFGEYVYSMPLYHWLSAIPFLVFGSTYGTIAYVLMQGIFDAGTCLVVYGIASWISARVALAAALCAILNPTQVVLSGLFYTDTPFIFFVAMSFLATFRWFETPSWRNAALLGLFLGCAALIRAVIVPWSFFALILLSAYALFQKLALRRAGTIAATFVALTACVGVIVAKNVAVFGTPGLTPQGGIHLALWVVPLAREMQDRTPYMTSYNELEKRTIERFGPHPANPFEQSRQYTIIAKEALKDIPFSAIAKSWLSGMTINLVSPAVLLSPPVLKLPRPGFYNTPGNSFFDKTYNYAFHSGQPIYTWCLLIGSAGLAVMRVLQFVEFIALTRRAANWPALFLAASWFGYILLVNGPVASPKYRLPLEPLFNVLSGAGLIAIRDRDAKAAPASGRQTA
jgi:4-amino-4-deoxy-L-arabinose transferase-like glycosyltransferase